MTSWLLLALAAAPVDARFVLDVAGVPVTELHVGVDGDTYFYESTPFFTEDAKPTRCERSLGDGTPEVLALLAPPGKGCRTVVEERTGRDEALCVTKTSAHAASGTIDGQRFDATYVEGRLASITVGSAKWRAVSGHERRPDVNPFVAGVAVPPRARVLVPEVAGARWLTTPPRGVGGDDAGRTRCLVLAREYASKRRDARVVTGVVIENGRAYPHAWVATAKEALDPSLAPGDDVQRQYVEFPQDRAGALFLALFDGALKFEAAR